MFDFVTMVRKLNYEFQNVPISCFKWQQIDINRNSIENFDKKVVTSFKTSKYVSKLWKSMEKYFSEKLKWISFVSKLIGHDGILRMMEKEKFSLQFESVSFNDFWSFWNIFGIFYTWKYVTSYIWRKTSTHVLFNRILLCFFFTFNFNEHYNHSYIICHAY